MSADTTPDGAPTECGIMRLYMKSGNVITLPRVLKAEWKSGPIKRMAVEQGGPPGGERIMMQALDLDQVEAVTWEDVEP